MEMGIGMGMSEWVLASERDCTVYCTNRSRSGQLIRLQK